MQKKAFIFTALLLLSGLGSLLFGQKTQANLSFPASNEIAATYTSSPFASTVKFTPDGFSAASGLLNQAKNLITDVATSGFPKNKGNVSLNVDPTLVFSPTSIPDGQYGTPYVNQTLTVTGGTAPYLFSVTGNSLPPGMSLSTDGILSGTPTTAGTYLFTVTAQDNSPSPGPFSGTQDYTLVIDQAVLTITAANATMSYGGTLPAFGVSYSGFVNGDNASSVTTPPTLSTTATSSSPAGVYSITAAGAIVPNYNITYNPGTLTITPVALTIAANDASMTYGGTLPSLSASYTGFVNGDNSSSLSTLPTISTTANSSSPAGTYPITASGAVNPNYTFTYQSGTMTVGKASLTVTADDKSMPLGGPLPTLTISYTGFVNGDNASSLAAQATATTTATATSPVGTYAITSGGGSSSNYTFNYVDGTLTVGKAVLTITADPAGSVYGAPLVPGNSLTVSYSGFVNGDDPGSLTKKPVVHNSATNGAPVGSYTLVPSGAQSPNYTIQYVNGTYTIDPATLTVTADNKTMPLGGPLPNLTISYTGFVNGDKINDLTTKPTATTTATASSPAGVYDIIPSGGSSPNYIFNYVSGTLAVGKAVLTITANPASSVYGDPIVTGSSLTVSYSGFVNGDGPGSLTQQPIVTNSASTGSSVGSFSLVPSGAVSSNYTIQYVNGTYTISRATLTVTADNKNMPLGGPVPTLTISYAGFVNGDDVNSLNTKPKATTAATASSPAGAYTITPSGGSSPNYTFNYVNGTLAVGKALLTITANPASSIYGASLVPGSSLTVSYSGFVNGDGPGNMTVPPTVTNAAFAGAPAGNYTLTPSGAVNPNYTIVYVNGNYTISPAILNVTADNKSMSLGGPLPTLTVSYTGFVNGDDASDLTIKPTAATTATAASPAGVYPITPSGGSSSNYTFSYISGTLTVSKAILTIMANPASSIYGAPLVPGSSLTVSYSGFVNGDGPGSMIVPPIITNTAYSGAPAGGYLLIPSGAVNPNYTIVYTSSNYTIKPAALTATADNKSMALGGPLPNLTISYTGFVNGDNASSLTTQPIATTTATAASPAGIYTITPGGGSSTNYTFNYVNGSLAVGKALLTITANPASSIYGSSLVPGSSLTVSYSGFVNGDGPGSMTVPPTVTNTAYAGAPAGSYTLIPSGAVNPNYAIAYVNGNYTISPAILNVTAANQTMTYGGTLPQLTASYSGFVNGDNPSSLATPPVITTTATSSSPAGPYSITASGAIDPNYDFTYIPGTLAINPAALLVTANAQTKEYGVADPTLTYTVSGFLNGDDTGIFTGSLGRTAGEEVGTYPITKGSLSAGNNYTINYNGNNLTITIASQKITWSQSLIVGCNDTTLVHLTATASSGLPVTYSVSDPDLATVSGNVLTLLKPGTTFITATQAGDANHSAAPSVIDTVIYEAGSLIRQHWSDAIFFDNTSGDYVQWQWYKNVEPVDGATNPYYSETPSLNGQYFVIATNKSGQQVQSCTLNITAGAAIPGGIKAYPNPANMGALVTVTNNYSGAALQGAIMQIVDITGRVRQQLTNILPSMQVTMPSESGIFIINLLLASGQKASTNVLVQ